MQQDVREANSSGGKAGGKVIELPRLICVLMPSTYEFHDICLECFTEILQAGYTHLHTTWMPKEGAPVTIHDDDVFYLFLQKQK
jgi:hypothetical protein